MKPEDFKKLIRDSVNEELRVVLPSILQEFFEKRTDIQPIGVVESTKLRRSVPTPPSTPVPKSPIQFTKNKILNDLLNETVVKIPPEGSNVSIDSSAPSVTEVTNLPGNLSEVFSRNYSAVLKKSAAINANKT